MIPFLVVDGGKGEYKIIRDSVERAAAFALAVMGRNVFLTMEGTDVGHGWKVENSPFIAYRRGLILLVKQVEEAGSIEVHEERMLASVYVSASAVTSPRRTITFTIIDYEKEIDDEKEGDK